MGLLELRTLQGKVCGVQEDDDMQVQRMRPWARFSDEGIRTLLAHLKTMNYASVADSMKLNRDRVWRLV